VPIGDLSDCSKIRPFDATSAAGQQAPMPVTLVTGTSTGIGFATALHLAKRGHAVVATMRSLAKAGPLEAASLAPAQLYATRALKLPSYT